MPKYVPPFAVSEAELSQIENFCQLNGLDEVGRVCAELRVLRTEYLAMANRLGKLRAMIETLEHNPQRRYGKELDSITGGA